MKLLITPCSPASRYFLSLRSLRPYPRPCVSFLYDEF